MTSASLSSSSRKRRSDTAVIPTALSSTGNDSNKNATTTTASAMASTSSTGSTNKGGSRLRVRINRYHGVAQWAWGTKKERLDDKRDFFFLQQCLMFCSQLPYFFLMFLFLFFQGNHDPNEVCGICQSAYEGVAPGGRWPGEDCPVVWGKCSHSFHLQCVVTWLNGPTARTFDKSIVHDCVRWNAM